MDIRCYRNILSIPNTNHVTNEEVSNIVNPNIGQHEYLLFMLRLRKMRWYGHVTRSTSLAKTSIKAQWVVKERETGREKIGRITAQNGQVAISVKRSGSNGPLQRYFSSGIILLFE